MYKKVFVLSLYITLVHGAQQSSVHLIDPTKGSSVPELFSADAVEVVAGSCKGKRGKVLGYSVQRGGSTNDMTASALELAQKSVAVTQVQFDECYDALFKARHIDPKNDEPVPLPNAKTIDGGPVYTKSDANTRVFKGPNGEFITKDIPTGMLWIRGKDLEGLFYEKFLQVVPKQDQC